MAQRFLPVAATLLAAALLAPAPRPAPGEPPDRDPTAAETRAEFLALCRAEQQSDDVYFGDRLALALKQRLQFPVSDPQVEVGMRARLGHEVLRLDRPAEAIDVFAAARDLAAERGLPDLFRLELERDLALAHVQLAEDRNCVHQHTAASCILPIAPGGVHQVGDDMRRAGDLYLAYLGERPFNLQVRWLLNLARMISGDYPAGVPERFRLPAGALDSAAPFPRWTDVAPALGVNAFDLAGGAAMEDFDGDGLLDLVTSTWDPCDHMKAFRNDGRGGFEDVTAAWGLDAQYGGLNLVQADYDNDGRVDLLVLRGAWRGARGEVRNSLLHNEIGGSEGRFVDVTRTAGVDAAYPTQTAAWADYDGDGLLDLYVGAEATADRPYPGQLLHNRGDGTFADATAAAGVANRRYAKGVAWGDYDGDGDPDLYVSNVGPNRLYRNDGDGTFTDVAPDLGVEGPERSFATWFFDVEDDGDLDLFVADYGVPYERVAAAYLGVPQASGHPVLYRNDGGRFTDVSAQAGFTRPLLPMGANYGDLDNDGLPDVYLGTGIPNLEALMPNVMYHNAGGGRFEDVTSAGGFGHLQKGHGIAFGDLDNDGDQDLFEEMGGAYPVDAFFNALYENPGNDNRWITLRLVGRRANRFAVGGRIEVRVRDEGGGERSVHALVGSGGSFGASSLQQEIGLGRAAAIEAITVRWPGSGTVQTFTGARLDRAYRAIEGEARLEPLELPRIRLADGLGAAGAEVAGGTGTAAAAPGGPAAEPPRAVAPDHLPATPEGAAPAPAASRPAAGAATVAAAALLAAVDSLQEGDLEGARRRLEPLAGQPGGSPLAVALVAALAARTGAESGTPPPDGEALPPPADPLERLAGAELLLLRRRGDDALALLAPLLPQPPLELAPQVLRAAGRASLAAGRLDEAIGYLAQVADGHTASTLALGEAHYRQGNAEAALAVLEPAVRDLLSSAAAQAGPRAPDLLAEYGRIATAAGRPEQAIPALQKAVELAPGEAAGWKALGEALTNAGRREEGAAALARFRELAAARERPPVDVAALAERQGEHARQAAAAVEEAQELARQGDREGALKLLRGQIEATPEALDPRLLEISILVGERRLDEALAAAQAAAEAFPADPEAIYHRAIVLMLQGDLGRAELDLRKTLELAPKHTLAMNNLAVVLLQRGATAEARELLEQVLALDPGNALATENLRKLGPTPH
jgi:Flp pilus assembly protein TadD